MKKALVVEDSQQLAEIWQMALQDTNFDQVTILNDGDDVEKTVEAIRPDIVLMDINLPGVIDGLELTKRIIQFDKTIPVLILTFHDDFEIINKAFQSGAKGYVVKTSTVREVRNAIQVLMSGGYYICEELKKFEEILNLN